MSPTATGPRASRSKTARRGGAPSASSAALAATYRKATLTHTTLSRLRGDAPAGERLGQVARCVELRDARAGRVRLGRFEGARDVAGVDRAGDHGVVVVATVVQQA